MHMFLYPFHDCEYWLNDSCLIGVGINQEYAKCYDLADCQKPKVDDAACERFCGAKSFLLYGKCDTATNKCCCKSKTK